MDVVDIIADCRYIMGTSSTLFNAALLQLNSSQAEGIFIQAIESILESIGNQENDVSRVPNTFANWNAQPNPVSTAGRPSRPRYAAPRAHGRSPTCNTSRSSMQERPTRTSPSSLS